MKTLQERMWQCFPEPQQRGLRARIADLCGVSAPTVTAWFDKPEKVAKIERSHAEKLCAGFGLAVSPAWLSEGAGDMLPSTSPALIAKSNLEAGPLLRPSKSVPVVGEVKGGDDGYLDELQYPVGHGDGTVDYPTADPNAYALRVRGDSMHPRYRAGEYIVVEPNIEAQPGDDVVVALMDGRKLLKELNWQRDGEVQLLSVNNHFGPLTLLDTEIHTIQLVAGRVRRSAVHKSE